VVKRNLVLGFATTGMQALLDTMAPIDVLVFLGIIGALLYTARVYRIRVKERALVPQGQLNEGTLLKPNEKAARDQMDRSPGGTLDVLLSIFKIFTLR
jgi:hypothetical protein